jgi:hypothetical protein
MQKDLSVPDKYQVTNAGVATLSRFATSVMSARIQLSKIWDESKKIPGEAVKFLITL